MDKFTKFVEVVPAISTALQSLSKIMGGLFSSDAPAIDVGELMRSHEASMERRAQEYKEQRERDQAAFMEKMEEMRNSSAAERDRMLHEFQREQERLESERKAEQERYEARINELAKSMKDAEDKVKKITEQLERPIKDRESKLAFVNRLNLKIQQTDNLLLLGPKGMGKSTFLWLLNKGDKPKRTTTDGTVEIIQGNGFVDSIGLRGWTVEELMKLLVLMIYEGIPKDLIIFGNDRIDLPVTSLGVLGVNYPMIVIMSSDFWKNYEPLARGRQKIHLVDNGGVRRVEPDEDLDYVYNLAVYDEIKEFHLGTPITHHDNLDELVRKRSDAGIRPFQQLMRDLGKQFTVGMENKSANMEALFRFIYIYEKKYHKDKLAFMNTATLQDFA
ncbi:uncharacterized protein LOC129593380 [Paramacrobiotus metropolitanus]|uniref:uncharacterized protein LOC129593380 n=1 Tax=Paramacrobiotus metropolitanus TaxID=2943436 RepID=UPI0024456965|nr:uncharacterized protein LOC129593380 [Paramacrobiotus metropolitanus]